MVNINVGIPQGSPISPMLFLFYIRDIIANKGFQLSYIDDFSLTVSLNLVTKNCQVLERIIGDLINKAADKKVQFDATKTKLIHFYSKRA